MRVNQVAAEFRKVSNKQMAETTKRTIRENVSINAQLAKMSDKTMELIQENDELRGKEKQQKQHIDMLEVNEKELAKKNISNLKVWSLVYNISWLPGFARVPNYAPTPCHRLLPPPPLLPSSFSPSLTLKNGWFKKCINFLGSS